MHNPNPKFQNREQQKKGNKNKKDNENKQSPLLSALTLPPLPGFSGGETDFHFCQFLSNFFRYSFSNFPSSYLYNIFAVYFSSNSPLLKSLSSICCGNHQSQRPIIIQGSKSLSKISSRNHKRTQQRVSAVLLLYLYKLHLVYATNS